MANSADKMLAEILAAVDADPRFEVRYTKKGHPSIYTAEGQWVTNFPGTPGSASPKRSLLNSLSPLKRAGFQWPPHKGKGRKK